MLYQWANWLPRKTLLRRLGGTLISLKWAVICPEGHSYIAYRSNRLLEFEEESFNMWSVLSLSLFYR